MQSVAKPAPARVLSIDVLRGFTIALMILVNDPGDWSHVYTQLDHAPWNGFTLTDFVFPSFLFLVGASIIFSLQSRVGRSAGGILNAASRRTLALHIVRRFLTLIAISLFLAGFPHFHWTRLRLFGVLPRIAVCYLIASLICLAVWNSRRRAHALIAIVATLVVGYWMLMRFVPVPGAGVPTQAMPILDPVNNLAAWLDRAVIAFTQRTLHTGHLYKHTSDPEGLLSTLPAIATTLIGSLTALWLRRVSQMPSSRPEPRSGVAEGPPHLSFSTPTRCLTGLILTGLQLLAFGLLWSHAFPLNKNLWTSSYVLYSAGWSLLLLALCYWLIDIRRLNDRPFGRALLWPWLVFGSNAITAFVLSNFLVELALFVKVPAGALVNPADPAARISSWLWAYRHLFARHDSTNVTSLAFALAFTAFCFLPNWLLWRKKIFLKI